MPPSPRYTVRLPQALDAQVQARVREGMPADLHALVRIRYDTVTVRVRQGARRPI